MYPLKLSRCSPRLSRCAEETSEMDVALSHHAHSEAARVPRQKHNPCLADRPTRKTTYTIASLIARGAAHRVKNERTDSSRPDRAQLPRTLTQCVMSWLVSESSGQRHLETSVLSRAPGA
nr:hypothetical protein CFP56_63476 [Quercus suber]